MITQLKNEGNLKFSVHTGGGVFKSKFNSIYSITVLM